LVIEIVIRVQNLTKTFKVYQHQKGVMGAFANLFSRRHQLVRAVNQISFTIDRGEIVGYLGPNGAGKSTTIKMLTGILVPTSGEVHVNGFIPHRQRTDNAKQIGVVFGQRTHLWFDLPVEESFDLLRHIYHIPVSRYHENLDLFNQILGLDEFFRTPVRQLSLGQRMRADIAAALLHDPEIVFLDEPTIGLDIVVKNRIRQFITQINQERGVTIILTTHDLDDVEKLCRRVILIDQAKIIFDGQLNALRNSLSTERLLVVDFAEDYDDICLPKAQIVRREKQRVHYRFSTDQVATAELIRNMLSQFNVADVSIQKPEIEEIVRMIYEKPLDL
jgi:ABC-2 type transport system ATP-binding protein